MITTNKNIIDLAPILSEEFIEYELPIEKIREYQRFYDSRKDSIGILGTYLLQQMHDCEIVSVNKNESTIDIELNDISFWIKHKDTHKKENFSELKFPFHLRLINVNQFSINDVSENGEIIEIEDYNLIGAEVMNDQLIHFDKERIDLALTIWKYSESESNYKLVLISAEKIDIIEKQEEVLSKLINKQ